MNHKAIALAMVGMLTLSGLTLLSTTVQATTLTSNFAIPDHVLCNYTFEGYSEGANILTTSPRLFFNTSTQQNTNLFVKTEFGSKRLVMEKTAASATHQTRGMVLPDLYQNFNLTYSFVLMNASSAFANNGFTYGLRSGPFASGPDIINWRTYWNAGQWDFFVSYGAGLSTADTALLANTTYIISAKVNDTSKVAHISLVRQSTGIQMFSTDFAYISSSGRYTTNSSWFYIFSAAGSSHDAVALDNITVRVPQRFIDTTSFMAASTSFSMRFDDGWIGTYTTAFPILAARHMNGTVAITTNYVGLSSAFMTWDQVRTLAQAGWDIASHSVNHSLLTHLSWSDAQDQLRLSKQYIEENITGYTVTTMCAPGGQWNLTLDWYARSIGYTVTDYTYFRTVNQIRAQLTNTSYDEYIECYGGSGYEVVLTMHNVSTTPTAIDVYPWQLHRMLNDAANHSWALGSLQEIYSYRLNRQSFKPTGIEVSGTQIKFRSNVDSPLYVEVVLDQYSSWSTHHTKVSINGGASSWPVSRFSEANSIVFAIPSDGQVEITIASDYGDATPLVMLTMLFLVLLVSIVPILFVAEKTKSAAPITFKELLGLAICLIVGLVLIIALMDII